MLEMALSIPADSSFVLSYDFEKTILRYTEYPPDPNRGFEIPPAVVKVVEARNPLPYYVRTTSLLLYLPTPDFSMPYNVIILTSTVVALGFGSIFNLLVRRFVAPDEVPAARFQGFKARIREALGRIRGRLAAKPPEKSQ